MSAVQLRGDRGGALIYVLIFGAFVGLILPTFSTLLFHSARKAEDRSTRHEFEALVKSIREQLEDPIQCSNEVLNGQVLPGFPGPVPGWPVVLNIDYGNLINQDITAGWTNPHNSIFIESVTLVLGAQLRPNPTLTNQIRVDHGFYPLLDSYEAEILIQPRNIAVDYAVAPYTGNSIHLRIPIIINMGGDRIVTCFGRGSAAAHCQSMGGAFDARPIQIPGTPGESVHPFFRCNPDGNHCFNGPQGLVNDPNLCTPPYAPQSVANAGAPPFLCTWCNDGVPNYPPYP